MTEEKYYIITTFETIGEYENYTTNLFHGLPETAAFTCHLLAAFERGGDWDETREAYCWGDGANQPEALREITKEHYDVLKQYMGEMGLWMYDSEHYDEAVKGFKGEPSQTLMWFVTFGANQVDANGNSLGKTAARVFAKDYEAASEFIFETRGASWSMLYSSAEAAGVEKYGLEVVELDSIALPKAMKNAA